MGEKLIELLWAYDQMRMMRMSIEECADHLIANGVTIPVRCKDCKYCDTFYPEKPIGEEARQVWFCKLYKHTRKPDEYCSDGERRSDD